MKGDVNALCLRSIIYGFKFLHSGESVAWINVQQNHEGLGIPRQNQATCLFYLEAQPFKNLCLGIEAEAVCALDSFGTAKEEEWI